MARPEEIRFGDSPSALMNLPRRISVRWPLILTKGAGY